MNQAEAREHYMRGQIVRLRALLEAEVRQLLKWAAESETGGWSTHQVGPMRQRAAELALAVVQVDAR